MTSVMKNTVVSFRYVMMNDKGQVLEDTTSGVPTRYLHGSDDLSAVLQRQMEGLTAGESTTVSLSESAGDCRFRVFIDGVRPAKENEVLLGYPLEVDCDEDCECHKN